MKVLSLFGIIAMWLLVCLETSDLVMQAWDWLTFDRIGGVAPEGLPEGIPPPPPPPPPTPIFWGREGAVSILHILLYANTALIINALRRQFGYEIFKGKRVAPFVYFAMRVSGSMGIVWGAGYLCYAVLNRYIFSYYCLGCYDPSFIELMHINGYVFLGISISIAGVLMASSAERTAPSDHKP